MLTNWLKLTLLSTLFLISSCGTTVIVPDIKLCVVRGVVDAGANCATSNSQKISEMTLAELIVFLEPSESKGPGIMLSSDDFTKLKTALEQVCREAEGVCKKEVQQLIETMNVLSSQLGLK